MRHVFSDESTYPRKASDDGSSEENIERLSANNEVKCTVEANETQKPTMTALGKIVFGDIHNRRNKTPEDVEDVVSLSLAYENIFHMPYDIIEKYSDTLSTLDISHNRFSRNLQFLSEFDNLTSLNLDYNNIDEHTVFPCMPKLELLWLNHNSIEDLPPFIKNLQERAPNLKYLSLMGNRAAPSYLNGGNFYEYLQYRLYVLSCFPHLLHLDDRKVTADQLEEAKRLYKRSLMEELAEHAQVPACMRQLRNRITNIFYKSDREKVADANNII